MPLDCVLINPGGSSSVYQNLSSDLTAIEPPTWVRMIAGWLVDNGYSVQIIDQNLGGSARQIGLAVADMKPKLVAIVVSGHQPSASTQQMTAAGELAKAIESRTIMVGQHPSALPARTLEEEAVDYVCDGEGPMTIKALLDGIPVNGSPGLWRRLAGDRHLGFTPPAPLIPIDELHGDVWSLLPMHLYRAHNWQCFDGSPRWPYASIYTSLGCPYKCSFCMINAPFHSNNYRMRDPELVVEQVTRLHDDYGVRTFKFADEMFVLNDRHVNAICEGLAAKPWADEINIWCYGRCDTIKKEQLPLMRKAGIRWLALGIESGSEHVRDGADKTLNSADIKTIVHDIQAAGINVIGNFMFGLPDDTMETMRETLDLAVELNCEFANFYSTMAYPGSRLFDETDPKDLPKNWSGYSQHSADCTPLPTATLTSQQVLTFRDKAFMEYFTGRRYLDMIQRKFGSDAVSQIKAMTAMKLPRKDVA